jgi:hypothetical protein
VGALAFALTGLGYLIVPGTILGIVGIESAETSDFLIRTEGVALLTGGRLLIATRMGSPAVVQLALVALAGYLVLGSIVDLVAFGSGIVGPASVSSVAVRIGLGTVCVVALLRIRVPSGSRL